MPTIEPCIRPPSEAESILLQITCGCSCNTCTFCGAYKTKQFLIKPIKEIFGDIDCFARQPNPSHQLFLMDGDALVLNNHKLLPVLQRIRQRLPSVNRIASYANATNITDRSAHELQQLFDHNLKLIYLGLESGSQEILDRCRKKPTARHMIDAVRKAHDAGIHSSVMVLLGLGGTKHSQQHIVETAAALNEMQPRYLSFLSLMIVPQTVLADQQQRGEFKPLSAQELLIETYEILTRLTLRRTQFYANHASNYLPLAGRLPQAKEELLHLLEAAIKGKIDLTPEFLRGL